MSSVDHDVSDQVLPVLRLTPNFIRGKGKSEGYSKLCHKTRFIVPFKYNSFKIKLPESNRVATVFLGGL